MPVLAYAATAVPAATMDGSGILFHRKDPLRGIAALIDAVVSNAGLQEAVARQDAALERLQGRDFGGLLLRFVDEALNTQRRRDAVAFDFCRIRSARRSGSEDRSHRPAAFERCRKALPPDAPGDTGHPHRPGLLA
ncbi:MAG: hypothetical protein R2708_16935 [Vicinamibacterales bacterium]